MGRAKANTEIVTILIIGVILCFVVSEPTLVDMTFMPRWLLWSGITLILGLLLAFKKSLAVPKNLLIPAFLAYLIIAIVSLSRAYNVGEGVFEVCKIALMFAYLIVAASIIKDIKDIAKPLTVLALVLGLYGLWYIYNIWEGQGYNLATMENKNIWSQSQLLLLPFCLYIVFRDKQLYWRIIGAIASLAAIGNIIIPQTRSAILGLAVSVAAVLFVQKRVLILCILVLLLIGACGAYLKLTTNTESLQVRLCMWKQTLKLIRDRFMVGAGNWKLEIPLYASGFRNRFIPFTSLGIYTYQNECTLRPHNDYLWVAAELSPIGLVFYLSLFALSIFYARHNPYVLMGLVGYMVIAFFSFPKERASLSMMLIIFMVLAISNSPRLSLDKAAVNCAVIISIVLVMFNFATRTESAHLSRKVLEAFARKNKDWSEVIRLTENFTPPSYINRKGLPNHYYLGSAYALSGDYNRALIAYLQAENAHSNHIYILSGLGICYSRLGMYDKSVACFEKALYISPNFEYARQKLRTLKVKGKVQ